MLVPVVKQFGTEAVASFFNDAVRAFQRAKAVKMRQAANIVRDDARRKAEAVIRPRGLRRGFKVRKDSKGRRLGPLVSKIRARVKLSRSDVYAVIGPTRLAFYGRFLESGVDRDVTRKRKDGSSAKSYRFRLVARPFLEPAARVNAAKVTEIIGDSYDVFTKGGVVSMQNSYVMNSPLTGRAASWAEYRMERSRSIASAYERATGRSGSR